MKSRLLDRKALDSLIMAPDVDSLIVELEKTPYGDDIAEASTKYAGINCIEYALRHNFTRTFDKILGFMEDAQAAKYIRIYLRRWDIQNIKTIIRGKNVHATREDIFESLVPAGDLDDVTLVEMIKQPDVKAVIDLLATMGIDYARPLTRHFREFSEGHELVVLEMALDRFYYEQALEVVKGKSYDERLIREMLATEIDVLNLKTAMRMIRDKIEPEDSEKYLIPGGMQLRPEHLHQLLEAREIGSVIERLKGTRYGFLAEVSPEYYKGENISELEKRLDRFTIRRGLNAFAADPLSIAVSIGYFWAKLNEITNLRVISRCKTADISEDAIRKELNYV